MKLGGLGAAEEVGRWAVRGINNGENLMQSHVMSPVQPHARSAAYSASDAAHAQAQYKGLCYTDIAKSYLISTFGAQ